MEPIGCVLRPINMDTSRVVVRPAPQFEHPGRWAAPCECTAQDPVVNGSPPSRASARVLRAVPPAPGSAPDRVAVSAREFAIAAMTVVLEVIDRRRPVSALEPLVSSPVADHVISRSRARYEARAASGSVQGAGAAGLRLHRVHIQFVDNGAAEFFGSYTRGERVRAFAGRMAATATTKGAAVKGRPKPDARRPAWQIQGLMLD